MTTTTRGSYAVVISDNMGCIDTSDCIELYSSGTQNSLEEPISITPIPFLDRIYFGLTKSAYHINMTMDDVYGRRVMSMSGLGGDEFEIHTESLSKGIYILRIVSEDFNRTAKLLKG